MKKDAAISPTTGKLNAAISTTEFLLNLPLEDLENRSKNRNDQDDGDFSCDSSLSSMGGHLDLDENVHLGEISCSQRLQISFGNLLKENSGRDMHFSNPSLKSGLSLTSGTKSLKSGKSFKSDGNLQGKPPLRRNGTFESNNTGKSGSTRSIGSLMQELEDGDPLQEWAQRSRSSINFPLRRSLSNGMHFERSPSQRSLASTDRLRRSLSNIVTLNDGDRAIKEANRDKGTMGASSRSIRSTEKRRSGTEIPVRRVNSAGANLFASGLSRKGSFKHSGSSHLPKRRALSPKGSGDTGSIGKNSVNTAKGSTGSIPSEQCPRKVRRRRSRNNLVIDSEGQLRRKAGQSRSPIRNYTPDNRSPARRVNSLTSLPTGQTEVGVMPIFIKRTVSKERLVDTHKQLLEALNRSNTAPAKISIKIGRRFSDPNRTVREAIHGTKQNNDDTSINLMIGTAALRKNSSCSSTGSQVCGTKSFNCLRSSLLSQSNSNETGNATWKSTPDNSQPSSQKRRSSRSERILVQKQREESIALDASLSSIMSSSSQRRSIPRSSSKLEQLAAMTRAANSSSNASFCRTDTQDSIRSFKASSRMVRNSVSTSSSNMLAMAMANGPQSAANTRGRRSSGGQAMMPGIQRVLSSSAKVSGTAQLGGLQALGGKPTSKNAEWSSMKGAQRAANNPFLQMVNMTPGSPSGSPPPSPPRALGLGLRPQPTRVKPLLLDSSSKGKSSKKREMGEGMKRASSCGLVGSDRGLQTDSRRRNRRIADRDGRPSLQKKTSEKDLVAALNKTMPNKVLVLENIKTLQHSEFKSNGKIMCKSSGKTMSGGKTPLMGDKSSQFVTGSRIRRFASMEDFQIEKRNSLGLGNYS
jgi:hypothetical protein